MNDVDIRTTKIIVFDLDNTLAPSKEIIDEEMAGLLCNLLHKRKVAVISGQLFNQFERELINPLDCTTGLSNLHIFPTDGTAYYTWNGEWTIQYQENLSSDQKKKITDAFEEVMKKSIFEKVYSKPEVVYGEIVEDRGSQITFSAIGQQAPLEIKKNWDPSGIIRKAMKEHLDEMLPGFQVSVAGTTSIDVTPKNHDKAYAIYKIRDILNIPIDNMVFIGDALFPEGNDYPVISTGIKTISVNDPEGTKEIIKNLLLEA